MTTVLSQNCHVIVIAFNFTMNFPTAWRPSGRAGSWRWVQVCEASRLPGLANTMQAKYNIMYLPLCFPVQAGHEREGRRVRCPPHSCRGLRESGDVKKSVDYVVDALVVVFRKILFPFSLWSRLANITQQHLISLTCVFTLTMKSCYPPSRSSSGRETSPTRRRGRRQ